MFKKGHYEEYVAEMLDNPKTRPVFEEYYSVRGRYPPYLIDFNGTDDELIAEVKRRTERARTLKSASERKKIAL